MRAPRTLPARLHPGMTEAPGPEILLPEAGVAEAVSALADRLAPRLSGEAVCVCLLTGGLWFAADLTRALAARGRPLAFDALWLTSYGDRQMTSGAVSVLYLPETPPGSRTFLELT